MTAFIQFFQKHKNFFVLLIKVIVVVLSLLIIYREVVIKENFKNTLNNYAALLQETHTWYILTVLIMMMFLNWLLESLKWRILLIRIQKVSIGLSLRAIFSGLTISFFTPNRIGEYAGRVLHLETRQRIQAVFATVVGSMNQLLITLIFGVISLMLTIKISIHESSELYFVIAFISLVALIILIVFYFNLKSLYEWLQRKQFLRKINKYLKVISSYNSEELKKISFLSAARYLIFITQYFLLMQLLGVKIEYFTAMRLITLIFLVMSIVPSFAIAELGVRGSIALYFMQPYSENVTGIVASSFSLWFINLVIPAIIGAFTLIFVKVFKEQN